MNQRPDHRRIPRNSSPLTKALGFGVTWMAVVGTMPPLPAAAQAERIAALDQPSAQHGEAFENWMLLAIEGDAEAQFNLGLLYSEGKGVPTDYQQAAFWYRKGAEQGHTGAQYNLAHLYLDGYGVDKDPERATHWWQQAAQRGHVLAQQYLGYAYLKGIGVDKDQRQALRWFREAAKGGDRRAQMMLATIEQNTGRTSQTAEDQGLPSMSTATGVPRQTDVPAGGKSISQRTLHLHGTTTTTPTSLATAPSASQRQPSIAADTVPRPARLPQPPTDAPTDDDRRTTTATHSPVTTSDTGTTAPGGSSTVPMESNPEMQTGPADPPPVLASSITDPATVDAKTTAVGGEDHRSGAVPEPQPVPPVPKPASSNEIHTSGSDPSQARYRSTVVKPFRLDAQRMSALRVDPQLTGGPAATTVEGPARPPTSTTENDRWLFAQSPDHYTMQLISAPRRAIVDAFIQQHGLKNTRLLRTKVNGEWWWYLLFGRYPDRERAAAAAAASIVEQDSIWIRRFGALQENRCKNLSVATPSGFCRGNRAATKTVKHSEPQKVGRPQAYEPAESARSNQNAASATQTGFPPAPAPAGAILTEGIPTSETEQQTAVADLRHDDNAWLFAQPENYYTVQLISVPDVSQITRFLQDHKLQDKAIYYTTRRDQRNWYFAIYGSHPDLDTAKQATTSLPVASGSVWIRQFDAIQKKRCRMANQLPDGASEALHVYCRP